MHTHFKIQKSIKRKKHHLSICHLGIATITVLANMFSYISLWVCACVFSFTGTVLHHVCFLVSCTLFLLLLFPLLTRLPAQAATPGQPREPFACFLLTISLVQTHTWAEDWCLTRMGCVLHVLLSISLFSLNNNIFTKISRVN